MAVGSMKRPEEIRAFVAYHDALMLRESGLAKAELEMIVAVAGDNVCLYCFVARGDPARLREESAPRRPRSASMT